MFDADSRADPLVTAVCETIDDAERQADVIGNRATNGTVDEEAAKEQCNQVLPYNAEGAVNLASSGQPDVWIGLRAPLLGTHPVDSARKDLAILLHLKGMDAYTFDGLALLDMDGRGVRDLTLADGWVWVIAGPPDDLPNGSTEPFELRRFPVDGLAKGEIIETEVIDHDLPTSAEGLAILDGRAIIVIDGDDGGEGATKCKTSSGVISQPMPKP
jgi:hypothetical protein